MLAWNTIYFTYNLGGAAIGWVMPSFRNDFAHAKSEMDEDSDDETLEPERDAPDSEDFENAP